MMFSQARFSLIVLLGSGSLATLLITPFLSLDPINLPKMLVVVTGASLLLTHLAINFNELLREQPISNLRDIFNLYSAAHYRSLNQSSPLG